MPIRRLTDTNGATWEVYAVPAPKLSDSRSADLAGRKTEEGADIPAIPRSPVNARLADGWLCFEGVSERRRLGPVPENWEGMSASQLEELLHVAIPSPTLKEK